MIARAAVTRSQQFRVRPAGQRAGTRAVVPRGPRAPSSHSAARGRSPGRYWMPTLAVLVKWKGPDGKLTSVTAWNGTLPGPSGGTGMLSGARPVLGSWPTTPSTTSAVGSRPNWFWNPGIDSGVPNERDRTKIDRSGWLGPVFMGENATRLAVPPDVGTVSPSNPTTSNSMT